MVTLPHPVPADYVLIKPSTYEDVQITDYVKDTQAGYPRTFLAVDKGKYSVKPDGSRVPEPDERIQMMVVESERPEADKLGSIWSWKVVNELTNNQLVYRAPDRARALKEAQEHAAAAEKIPMDYKSPAKPVWPILLGVGAAVLGVGGFLYWLATRKKERPSLGDYPETEFMMGDLPEEQFLGARRRMGKMSRAAQRFVSTKIRALRHEGYPAKQAARIAYEYARRAGYKVPEPRKVAGVGRIGPKKKKKRIYC